MLLRDRAAEVRIAVEMVLAEHPGEAFASGIGIRTNFVPAWNFEDAVDLCAVLADDAGARNAVDPADAIAADRILQGLNEALECGLGLSEDEHVGLGVENDRALD